MTSTPDLRARAIRGGVLAALALAALAALLAGRGTTALDGARPTAVPFPIPVYEIEAVSGSHEASLLNLPLPNVGAPQVPVPVDVNGDLLPDVTAAVNLVDAEGVFNNPPQVGEIVAPNIEINRLLTAPILTPGGDPLRINIKLTIVDLEGEQDPMTVRFGYDTGPGGSIPPTYKAIVGGLDSFFDPLVAAIDTSGGYAVGIDPGLRDLGLAPRANAYNGPLSTFADIDFGDPLRVAADMRFEPMPNLVEVSFGSGESSGQRFTFAHDHRGEVDLGITGHAEIDGLEADIDAAIDRLPSSVAVDIGTGQGGGGGVQYAAESRGGRLADLRAEIELHPADAARPIIGRIDAESLPDLLGAEWSFSPDGAPQVTFEGSGQGIGAIEARVQNYVGEPTDFEPHVPGERQHVSIQAGPGGPLVDDTLLQARLERIRGAEVTGTDDGAIEGSVRIGDGERPLEIHGELDLREADLPYIDATAVISPLPDVIDFAITPALPASTDTPDGSPLTIVYEPSESIDVDTEVLVGLPGTSGALACGDPGTACAEADIRNVPTRIEARLVNLADETRVEVDAIPRDEGGAPLDVFGSAVVGPVTDLGTPADAALAAPVHAEFAVQGLPRYARLRTVEGAGGNVERVDVRTCDLVYETGECEPGTTDEVAEMTFGARNFGPGERPEDLPPPPQSGPLYVTVTAQGLPDTNELVHWEASGRMTDFRELTYLGTGDLTAARVDIGGNQDFRAFVDLDDIDLDGGSPADGRVDVDADVLVERLPAPLTFCMAQDGRPLTSEPLDPITAGCEDPDPFADGSVETGPLTIHYEAPGTFSVHTEAAIEGDLPFEQPELPIDFGEIHRIAAGVDLTDIPGEFTGYVGTLVDGEVGEDGTQPTATRVRTVAPGADATKLVLTAEVTTEGVECADPDPEPLDGDAGAVCASVVVDGLPEFASILAGAVTDPDGASGDDALVAQAATFLACDLDLATDACRPGTEGSIGEIDVDVRAHAGAPDGVPAYAPPADEPHVYAQADVDSLGDFEIEAGLQIFDLREVRFEQGPDGLVGATDVGDGILPLTVHAYADLRDLTELLPGALRAQAVADVVLDPLPQTVDLAMTSPGANQSEPVTIHADVSQASLLTVDAEVRELGVPDDAECGARGTYCAALEVDRLPQTFDATISREFSDDIDPAQPERDVETRMVVTQTRFAPADAKADIEVHAGIGLPIDAPVIGDGPVFADLVLTGVPNHLSVGLDSHEVLEEGTGPDTYDVAASALERVQIHTCRRDFDAEACEPGTEDQLDLLQLSARTFRLRPTDFPAPLADGPPLYVAVTGRETNIEAVVEIPAISEFQFLNRDGTTAATARAGGGTPADPKDLQIRVDVQDLPLAPRVELGDLDVVDPMVTIDATVDVTPFPGDLAFCLRNGGAEQIPAPSGLDFTATCEDTDPFGDGVALDHTPLSVGFDANDDFEVHVDAEVGIDGLDEDSAPDPEDRLPIETHRLFGTLDMLDLPSHLELHFLQPGEEDVVIDGEPTTIPQGPFRGLLHTEGADSGIDVAFSAGLLIGADTICEDPRPGRSATCVSLGTPDDPGIEDLPTDVEFFYDPDVDPYDPAIDLSDPTALENFVLRTDGTGGYDTQIDDLHLSSVNPPLEIPELEVPMLGALATDAIVVDADLGGLPQPFDLRGTLLLTDESPTAVFEVQNGDAIPGADVHVRNFLSPDPTVGLEAPNRPVADDPAIPTYEVQAFQRGPAVRVDVELLDPVQDLAIRSFGLRPVRSAEDRRPLGTTAIDVGFATDFNVRAYVDLLPEPGFRIIGDVLVGDMPANVDVCVRGPRAQDTSVDPPVFVDDLPYPGTGTWCDDPANLAPGEGGLRVDQQPDGTDRTMDLDAFARLEYGGGSSVIAGRVDIDEMPQIVEARFPGGSGKDVEINTFSRVTNPLTGIPVIQPDGIDRIRVEAASFDLEQAATGIVGDLPYSPLASRSPSLRADDPPADGREYVHGAADLSAGTDVLANVGFHVRAQIGRDDAAPSSQLQTFQFTGEQCPVPLDENGDPRADYPRLPTDDGTGYTCIRAVFEDPTPLVLDDDVNPLSLDATVLVPGGALVDLHDAGLSDVPDWIQVQLAEAETFTDPENNRGWRRPCPPISETGDTDGCMAPRMRFDQPDESYLFGQVDYGQPSDLALLDDPSTDPNELAPDFDAIPTGAGWDSAGYAEGIRVKVLNFTGGTVTELADDRQAARASFRLAVPGSIQLEQTQNFDLDLRQRNQDGDLVSGDAAKDMRFAFTVRDHEGELRTSVGQLSAMLHLVETDSQLLLTQPCDIDVAAFDATEPREICSEYAQGVEIPGHVALSIYTRDNLTDVADDQQRSSTLLQIDGRITTPADAQGLTGLDIGARLLGNDFAIIEGDPTEGFFANDEGAVRMGTAEVVLANLPATDQLGSHVYEPDFRFRTELVSDGARPEDDPDPSTYSEEGTVSESRDNTDGLNEWYEFTLDYDIGIENVLVGFDMNPNEQVSTQAKQLDAVIFLDMPRIGADLQAFNAIGGSTPAEVSVGASIAVTPLDVDISSNSNIGANINQIVQNFIEEEIGAPDWLADIIGVIISPITSAIDAILNLFDLGVRLQSDLLIQFTVDRLSEFQIRNNILHVNMNGAGDGLAEFGPINWYIDEFAGGVDLEIPAISIPDWICWVPGIPCSIGGWNILLAGYSYLEGIPAGSFGLPIAMDFRDCDALGGFASIVPFLGGGFDNTVTLDPTGNDSILGALTGGDEEDFVMWIGTDPRMSVSGLLVRALDVFTFGGFSTVLDLVIDIVAGPIFCHVDAFSVDAGDFVSVGYDPANYHPGTPNPLRFAGHPVPGQPGAPLFAPEGTEEPPVGPIEFPPVDPSVPPEPEPIVPPVARAALYSGPAVTTAADAALCGVHELSSLTLQSGSTITVATAANGDTAQNPLGTGVPCPAGSEGTLEIRANTLTVAAGATIDASGISADIPDLVNEVPLIDDDDDPVTPPVPYPGLATPDEYEDLYRATGSSGGTNAGVGYDGSAPSSGFQPYEGGTEDTTVYPGGPGSSVGTGFDLQAIAPDVATPDTVDAAGAGGLGGGAVVLRADTLLTVAGSITADGTDGAGSTAGECDSDPFEDPSNDTPIYNDEDPPEIIGYTPVADDPPAPGTQYEHVSGSIGAGGGAGGGIALQARTEISLTGSLSATGGDGGDGVLGAGGGGGGGAIKLLAPVVGGTVPAAQVAAGGNGDPSILCDGVPAAATPRFDDPTTADDDDPAGQPAQAVDGRVVVVDTPAAELRPYGPEWWAGGDGAPYDTFDAYLVGGGGAGTTVYVCAVYVPLGVTYDADVYADEVDSFFTPWDDRFDDPVPTGGSGLAAAMNTVLPRVEVDGAGNPVTFGSMPSAADPCGEPASDHTITGGVAIQQVRTIGVSGGIVTPAPYALDIDTTGLYGFYTTAVRGGDVEALGAVEWVTKVDATRPNVEIASPVEDPTPTSLVAGVPLDFVADDLLITDVNIGGLVLADQEVALSGLDRVECRVYAAGSAPGAEEGWFRCTDGQYVELLQPDGTKVIETRAFDNVGNVSSLTANPDGDTRDASVDIILDISPPEADLLLQGGTQGGLAPDPDPDDALPAPNWYRVAPSVRITGYTSESPSAATPYVFRFDNGTELACEGGGTDSPPDCVLTSAEVDALLATGPHTVHWSAVNAGGNRYRDDNDGRTPSPMPFRYFALDTDLPLVEVSTVPLRPDQELAGQDWYDDPVAVVLAALDQFGGSGLATLEYRFGAVGPYTAYDMGNPPMAPAGESTFCYRVTDVAGNVVEACEDLRVDSTAPAFSLTPNAAPDGEAGWYVTAPSFTVTGYDDGADGVGADADHFRTRTDNGDATDCDAPSCIIPATLATGEHLVHASAVDRFGNRSGEQTLTIPVDLEAPVVVPVIGPAEADGEHGWWHTSPFLTLFAVDPGDGSGVDTLEFSLDGGATWTTWTAPVRVGAGEHELCWRGDDVAGNDSLVGCTELFVDLDDPTAAIAAVADPASGWFTTPVLLTASAADAAPGAGLGANPSAVCSDLTPAPAALAVSGLCVSIDDGPYVPVTGAITAGEGVHVVRAYSVDRSGRRSAVVERTVRVDRSAPVVELRLLPPDPARAGWYRVEPLVVLRADDGDQGSGVTALEYRIDGGPWTAYEQPFEVPEGVHTVDTRASDAVGTRTGTAQVRVDLTSPTVVATTPSKLVWIRLLGLGGTNDLRYTVGDNLSGPVRTTVTIYDATGNPVRVLDGGTVNVVPGAAPVQRSVTWDGRDSTLTSLVPLGVYTYRVTAIDEAGNVAFSGESKPITIRVL